VGVAAVPMVSGCLACGADPSKVYDAKKRDTPLHKAASTPGWRPGAAEVVACLLEAGALVNAVNDLEETPLLLAADVSGCANICKCLLEFGADPTFRTENGWSPLNCAAKRGRDAIVKLLVRNHCPLEEPTSEYSALLHAAAQGHVRTVLLLLSSGADANVTDRHGDTALWKLVDQDLSLAALSMVHTHRASIARCSRDRKKVTKARLMLKHAGKKQQRLIDSSSSSSSSSASSASSSSLLLTRGQPHNSSAAPSRALKASGFGGEEQRRRDPKGRIGSKNRPRILEGEESDVSDTRSSEAFFAASPSAAGPPARLLPAAWGGNEDEEEGATGAAEGDSGDENDSFDEDEEEEEDEEENGLLEARSKHCDLVMAELVAAEERAEKKDEKRKAKNKKKKRSKAKAKASNKQEGSVAGSGDDGDGDKGEEEDEGLKRVPEKRLGVSISKATKSVTDAPSSSSASAAPSLSRKQTNKRKESKEEILTAQSTPVPFPLSSSPLPPPSPPSSPLSPPSVVSSPAASTTAHASKQGNGGAAATAPPPPPDPNSFSVKVGQQRVKGGRQLDNHSHPATSLIAPDQLRSTVDIRGPQRPPSQPSSVRVGGYAAAVASGDGGGTVHLAPPPLAPRPLPVLFGVQSARSSIDFSERGVGDYTPTGSSVESAAAPVGEKSRKAAVGSTRGPEATPLAHPVVGVISEEAANTAAAAAAETATRVRSNDAAKGFGKVTKLTKMSGRTTNIGGGADEEGGNWLDDEWGDLEKDILSLTAFED